MNTSAEIDRPFALPRESREVAYDIPIPPSVNRTRKVHWPGHRKYLAWKKAAGFGLVANGQWRDRPIPPMQRYDLTITLDRATCRQDPDNPIKAVCDLLRGLEIIADDSPLFAERILIQWGYAPNGCRVTLRSVHA